MRTADCTRADGRNRLEQAKAFLNVAALIDVDDDSMPLGAVKYERLYRHEIATVIDLADHVSDFIDEYNTTRPHESLDWQRPLEVYLKKPTPKPPPTKI